MDTDSKRVVDREIMYAPTHLAGVVTFPERKGVNLVPMEAVAMGGAAFLPGGPVKAYPSFADLPSGAEIGTLAYAEGKTWRKATAGPNGWALFLDFIPGSQIAFAVASATEGTPNAIEASPNIPVSAAGKQLVVMVPRAVNTSSPVTVDFGFGPLTIKTANGNNIEPGGLTPSPKLGFVSGTEFRLLSDVAPESLMAVVEAAMLETKAARDASLAAMSSVVPNIFATKAAAQAYNPAVAPQFIDLAYQDANQVGGSGGRYAKSATEPAFEPKFQIAQGSWYGLRQTRRWKPAQFGARGNGLVSDDAAFAALAQMMGHGDVVEFDGENFKLSQATFANLERCRFVGNATFTVAELAPKDQGNLYFNNCSGTLFEGDFRLIGPETQATWEALPNLAARQEERGLLFFRGSQDAKVGGIIRTSGTRSAVLGRSSFHMKVEGIRHTGFLADLPDIVDGNFLLQTSVDVNFLMTVRMLGCNYATIENIRSKNHGSTIINGAGAKGVTVRDIYGQHMQDNVVYNSSGDEFHASDIRGDHCVGCAIKSRGSAATVTGVKAVHCGIGVAITPYDTADKQAAWASDINVNNAIIAAYVFGYEGYRINDVTLSGVFAKNIKGTDTTCPIQFNVNGRFAMRDCVVDSFDANFAILGTGAGAGVGTGEANGAKQLGIHNNTIRNGQAAMQINMFREFSITGNTYDSLSAVNIVNLIECFDGIYTGNRSSGPTQRVALSSAASGCKRVRVINNDHSAVGPTTGNEYWGNANKVVTQITGNIPFRVGQMGFDSSTGKAMIAEGVAATTDWKLLY